MTVAYLAADSIQYLRSGQRILRLAYVDAIPGSITALIGVSGAGKTTLLEILVGIRRPSAGLIRWAGTDAGRAGPKRRARCGISFLPARPWLPLLLTTEEILSITGAVWKSDWRLVAEELELGDWMRRRVASLSGGERRLVELAVVLGCNPSALVLDEPFGALDPIFRARLARLLRKRADQGVAILFADHDPEAILTADRVFSMTHGTTRLVPHFKTRPREEWYSAWPIVKQPLFGA
jgi:ABC-type multidrug transport system ATPase subunit